MQTLQLPNGSWKSYLEQLTQLKRGDRIAVELGGGGLHPRCWAQKCPLVGVSAEVEDSQVARIEVLAGDRGEVRKLAVSGPRELTLTERDDGSPVALQIHASDGSFASLRFETDELNLDVPPGAFLG